MDLVLKMKRMPKVGETVQGEEIHYISGGKGANQAVGCARLGAEVNMIGAVGGDAFGTEIMTRMDGFGVRTGAISVLEGTSTGTATIMHTPEDNCIVIVPGANGHNSADSIAAHKELIRQSDVLIVQLEIPMPAVEAALRIARESGVRTVLNPAPALPLTDEQIGLADYFTPNETEFELYCGTSIASEEQLFEHMKAWQHRFPGQTLIVTRGKHGISCATADGIVTVPAPIVQVVDTTGAGDSFNAALCFGIASGWTLEQTLPLAVKAASYSVTVFGAQDGMPTMQNLS
ncbi:ribokinase [Paenibacillus montanisoli]|uniref:Deoxyribokinase n=2 Tax=Paenibacillus montanisoli TaxID=2081970 RepID=A0A328U894_9BACL|nr:ribokinase [Paenibacillus montanisoli]